MQRMYSENEELDLIKARAIVFKVISRKKLQGKESCWKVYWAWDARLQTETLAGCILAAIFSAFGGGVIAIAIHQFVGVIIALSVFVSLILITTLIVGRLVYKYTEYNIRKSRHFCVLTPEGFIVYERTEDHRFIAFSEISEILIGTNLSTSSLGKLWLRQGDFTVEFPYPEKCKVNVEEVQVAFEKFVDNLPKPKEDKWSPEDHMYRHPND